MQNIKNAIDAFVQSVCHFSGSLGYSLKLY